MQPAILQRCIHAVKTERGLSACRLFASTARASDLTGRPRLMIDRVQDYPEGHALFQPSRQRKKESRSSIAAESFGSDPRKVVQLAHEKERLAFRYALDERDFVAAYRIYRDQVGTHMLTAAEVTSLVQLIGADALLRQYNRLDQPEALKTVLWQIIDDVKRDRVPSQSMLWVFAIGALEKWGQFAEAHELWKYLEKLPMREFKSKENAQSIDARTYGAFIKLMVAEGRSLEEIVAVHKAATTRENYSPTLLLDEALVRAHFAAGDIGTSYKLMDKAIQTHRAAIRPGFFNAIIGLALDANAVGVAVEVFMKACANRMLVFPSQISRLVKSMQDIPNSFDTALLVVKKYRWLNRGMVQVECINALLGVAFSAGGSTEEVLSRVRTTLRLLKDQNSDATSGTINTLLGGYIALGEEELISELLHTANVSGTTFRTMLKALTKSAQPEGLATLQGLWQRFLSFRAETKSTMGERDMAMMLRAAGRCEVGALDWAQSMLAEHAPDLNTESLERLSSELERHREGTFVYQTRPFLPGSRRTPVVPEVPDDLAQW